MPKFKKRIEKYFTSNDSLKNIHQPEETLPQLSRGISIEHSETNNEREFIGVKNRQALSDNT